MGSKSSILKSHLLSRRAQVFRSCREFSLARDDCIAAINFGERPLCIDERLLYTELLCLLAICYLALGEASSSLQSACTALRLQPDDIAASQAKQSAENMTKLLESHDKARAEGNWRMAKAFLEGALSLCEGTQPLQWAVWGVEISLASGAWAEAEDQAL